jgi:hypothetical protein
MVMQVVPNANSDRARRKSSRLTKKGGTACLKKKVKFLREYAKRKKKEG